MAATELPLPVLLHAWYALNCIYPNRAARPEAWAGHSLPLSSRRLVDEVFRRQRYPDGSTPRFEKSFLKCEPFWTTDERAGETPV